MGMIELRRMSILINCMGTYWSYVCCNNKKTRVKKTIIEKSSLERVFIYMSRIPNLVLALDPPIEILVYLPTYNTKPIAVPLVNTVVVHNVF